MRRRFKSGWGKGDNVKLQNNPGSLMGASSEPWQFKTIDEGLEAYAKNLEDNYIKKGLTTVETIGPVYAPSNAVNDPAHTNNAWIPAVKQITNTLEHGKKANSDSKDNDEISSCSNEGESLESLKKYNGKFPETKVKFTKLPGNPNPDFECTWWVYNRRKELGVPIQGFGDAKDYPTYAKNAGWNIGKKPVQGAVMSIPANISGASGYQGHVAFVESVLDGGKKIHISEYNWDPHKYGERTLEVKDYMTFIYDKKK